MKNVFKKFDWLLIAILAISAFFRFYKFEAFQYWSGDEEIMAAVIRHIVWDKSPTLLIPNANLEFGLGPFYHYILAFFYFITDFNLVALQSIASVLGVATTFLVYKVGYELLGRKFGLISAFVYASSFFIAIHDRRLWPLTPDSFFMALTIYLLVRLIKGKKKWSFLLALPTGFAFHSDPTLLVVIFIVFFFWAVYRFSIGRKNVILAFLILGFFALPFLLADIRYNGAFHKPLLQSLTKPLRGEGVTSHHYRLFRLTDLSQVLSKVVFVSPSNFLEEEFCYCEAPKAPLAIVGTLLVFLFPVMVIVLNKKHKNYKSTFNATLIPILSLFIGIFIFNFLFKGNFHQHYFVIILPVFAIIVGFIIYFFVGKKPYILALILAAFFLINFYSLVNSEIKYPLAEKLSLVKGSLKTVSSEKFALYSSENPYIQGGGWTELYTLSGNPAVKSYWYKYLGWIYAAYSLYPTTLQNEDPGKIVLIKKIDEDTETGQKVLDRQVYKDIELLVIDNSDRL